MRINDLSFVNANCIRIKIDQYQSNAKYDSGVMVCPI